MSKFYALVVLLFLCFTVLAQSDRFWVGTSGSNWTSGASWSLTNGGAGGAGAPTSLQNAIFNGFTGTVNYDAASITINSLQIINSADVTLSNPVSTAKTISINDGLSTNQDMYVDVSSKLTLTNTVSSTFTVAPFGAVVNGSVILKGVSQSASGGRIDASNASGASPVEFNGTLELQEGTSNTAGTNFKFNAGSFYLIKKNGGNIPSGVWDANAEVQYLGGQTVATSTGPTFNGPPASGFGRFVYNVSNQSGTVNLSLTTLGVILNGDFKVVNTTGLILRLASTLTNVLVKGDFTVSGSSKVSMTNSALAPTGNLSLTINGDLIITSGSFDLQENSGGGNSYLKLKGALSIAAAGTLTATGNGTTSTHEVEFLGATTQALNINGSLTGMPQFKVNGAGLAASTNWNLPVSTNARLTFTAGNLDMGTNLLYIQNPATTALAGGTLSSHIIGKLRRATNSTGTYLFPISSSASELASVKIYPAATTGTDYQVQFFKPNTYPRSNADMPAGIVGIANYYWDISRPTGTVNADMNFTYGNIGGTALTASDVRVLHWNGTSPWDNLGGTDAGGGSVDVAGVTTFSPFTLGSTSQTLAVSFINFSGVKNGLVTTLRWTAIAGSEVKGYTIERSADGRMFAAIGFVPSTASGTSTTYNFVDNNAAGKQYYRLHTVTAGNDVKLSTVLMINDNIRPVFSIAGLYPNPVKNILNLQVQAPAQSAVSLQLLDVSGRVILQKMETLQAGTNALQVSIATVPKGQYLVQLRSDKGEVCRLWFSKQ